MRNCIICDIDHCLSDAAWRDGMLGGPWDDYHAASVDDKPATDICTLLDMLRGNGIQVIGLTSRPEKWRKMTMEWLVKHGIFMDDLLMRPDANFENSGPLKVNLAQAYFGDSLGERVLFVLDDRDDVVAGFAALGITSLQVMGRRY